MLSISAMKLGARLFDEELELVQIQGLINNKGDLVRNPVLIRSSVQLCVLRAHSYL